MSVWFYVACVLYAGLSILIGGFFAMVERQSWLYWTIFWPFEVLKDIFQSVFKKAFKSVGPRR